MNTPDTRIVEDKNGNYHHAECLEPGDSLGNVPMKDIDPYDECATCEGLLYDDDDADA